MSKLRDGVRRAEDDLQRAMDDALTAAQRAKLNPRPGAGSGKQGDPRLNKPRPTPPPNMGPKR